MHDHDDEAQKPRRDGMRLLAAVGVALLPAAVLLVATWLGPDGAAGRFRGALAGMIVIASVGAFGTGAGSPRALRTAMQRVAAAAFFAGLAYGLRGLSTGTGGGGIDVLVLYCGVGAGACGLAALGRAFRTPAIAAGAVAACVLWTAMAGLFWADPVAEHLERTRRRSLRQAVLHVDPSLALAYGAVGYDRLRSEAIYADVPLASSFYERPGALGTGSVWLAAGLVAFFVAVLVTRQRVRRTSPQGAAVPGAAVPGAAVPGAAVPGAVVPDAAVPDRAGRDAPAGDAASSP